MVAITTRESYGVELPWRVVDANFINLATAIDKIGADVLAEAEVAKDAAVLASSASASSASASGASASASGASASASAARALAASTSAAQAAQSAGALLFKNAVHIFDGESTNSPAAGGVGWVEVVLSMSSFVRRSSYIYAAEPGRNMANTLAAYDANVKPAILAAVAAGYPAYVYLQTGLNDYGLGPASNVITPWDTYAAKVLADGGTLVPMLTTRRLDWRGFDSVRKEINNHILSKGYRYTVDTDNIFTDPNFAVPDPQTSDGTHPNAATYFAIAVYVNWVMQAGGAGVQKNSTVPQRALVGSRLPYTNYSGQLTTDDTFFLDLATNAKKDISMGMSTPFPQTSFVGNFWYISVPGDRSSAFRVGAIGKEVPYPEGTGSNGELMRYSVSIIDDVVGQPAASFSLYQAARIFSPDGLILNRGGLTAVSERVTSLVAYPAANNSPGLVGQMSFNAATKKLAVYVGDNTNHAWLVMTGTNIV